MGVPTSEVGYISVTARRGDHESSYEHVVALEKKISLCAFISTINPTEIGFGFYWSLGCVRPATSCLVIVTVVSLNHRTIILPVVLYLETNVNK